LVVIVASWKCRTVLAVPIPPVSVEIAVLRQLTALFVAGAIALGNVAASASTTASPAVAAAPVAKNDPPLKPGGPAGIHQAQGIEDVDVWIISGLILGAIIWVLVGNDNDVGDSTNGMDAD